MSHEDLPLTINKEPVRQDHLVIPADLTMDEVQKLYTMFVLRRCNNRKGPAAKALGISIGTLHSWIDRWDIKDQFYINGGRERNNR